MGKVLLWGANGTHTISAGFVASRLARNRLTSTPFMDKSEPLCAVCGFPIALREFRTECAGRSIHIRCWPVGPAPAQRSASRTSTGSHGAAVNGGHATWSWGAASSTRRRAAELEDGSRERLRLLEGRRGGGGIEKAGRGAREVLVPRL